MLPDRCCYLLPTGTCNVLFQVIPGCQSTEVKVLSSGRLRESLPLAHRSCRPLLLAVPSTTAAVQLFQVNVQGEESSLNPPFRGFQVETSILSKPLAKNIFLKFGFLKSESFSSNVRLAAGATGKMLVCHAPTKKASLFTQQMRGPTVPVSMKLWRNWKGEMGFGYRIWMDMVYIIMCTHTYIYIADYSGRFIDI